MGLRHPTPVYDIQLQAEVYDIQLQAEVYDIQLQAEVYDIQLQAKVLLYSTEVSVYDVLFPVTITVASSPSCSSRIHEVKVRVNCEVLICILAAVGGDSSVVRAPDSNPCRSGGRIFFSRVSRVDFLC